MPRKSSTAASIRSILTVVLAVLLAFLAGRWSGSDAHVRAAGGDPPQIEVRDINGGTSLVIFYPTEKKVYVYQTPFVGLPNWPCAYSFTLGAPGAPINRQPCPSLQ
ncbi:MAG: hypothetical protein JO270_24915 [Acidobacteriaceae bacterium]|nr:hypothetical protein [Acidobacteriaceae bacterium]MBV8570338.1 hypothetical protein [Acidobacteriaceae bacterium]